MQTGFDWLQEIPLSVLFFPIIKINKIVEIFLIGRCVFLSFSLLK
jgi:hypothetical protein